MIPESSRTNSRLPAPFIVGAPRSGTTLLRLMLDSHPELAIPHETQFLYQVVQLAESGPGTLEQFHQLLVTHFTWPDFMLDAAEFRTALEQLQPFTAGGGLRTFYALYAARFDKIRWGEKTPDYGLIMPGIEALLEEAHFIHLIRDGRDVAVSMRNLWFSPGQNMHALAERWGNSVSCFRELGKRCRHYLEISYESLVRSPAETLKKICAYLDLPYEDSMLAYHLRSAERLAEIQGWHSEGVTAEQLRNLHPRVHLPPDDERVGRWKSELSDEEAAEFDSVAGEALLGFGYTRTTRESSPLFAGRNVAADSVTTVLLTDGLSDEAFEHFRLIRQQTDAFVIFVDRDHASEETRRRAAELGTAHFEISAGGLPEIRQEMIDACETEWILRIDSDEELSPEWLDGRWQQMLALPDYTHFFTPRRWLLNAHSYLDQSPWWPDPQLRLFRRLQGRIPSPPVLHRPITMQGRGGFCRSLAFHHHVLWKSIRAAREEKVHRYEGFRPEGALGFYYLPEDYRVALSPVPQPRDPDRATDLLAMEPLSERDSADVQICVSDLAERIAPRQVFWREVTVKNGSTRALSCGCPAPVQLSYHWTEFSTGRIVDFEGIRTPIFPEITAGATARIRAVIAAPAEPGAFLLQITLVQEGVQWFEENNPHFAPTAKIVVTG